MMVHNTDTIVNAKGRNNISEGKTKSEELSLSSGVVVDMLAESEKRSEERRIDFEKVETVKTNRYGSSWGQMTVF